MGSLTKHGIFAIGLLTSITAFGQRVVTAKVPSNLKDTVYLGITNKITLDAKTVSPTAVQSSDAYVALKGNELTIQPFKPGNITLKLIYYDSTVSRKLVSTYLPEPKRY